MNAKERQVKIQEFVAKRGPVQTAEVIYFVSHTLGEDVARATISRDLSHLVDANILVKEGRGPGTLYSIAPVAGLFAAIDVDRYFAEEQDARIVNVGLQTWVFEALRESLFTKNEMQELADLHEKFTKKIAASESDTLREREFERIMIEFSWKSSQIEGNTYSLLDTEALIKERRVPVGKTPYETQMILNHKRAFEFIREHAKHFGVLTRGGIEELHRILVHDLGISTSLRKGKVRITGTNYVPPTMVYQIEEALERMISLINAKESVFEKALLALALVAYIQPFEDGNKRVARTLASALLLAHDMTPLSYRAVDQVEYKKAKLLFYELGNMRYLKEIFMEQYRFAVENYF